jgi:hypothetical protein
MFIFSDLPGYKQDSSFAKKGFNSATAGLNTVTTALNAAKTAQKPYNDQLATLSANQQSAYTAIPYQDYQKKYNQLKSYIDLYQPTIDANTKSIEDYNKQIPTFKSNLNSYASKAKSIASIFSKQYGDPYFNQLQQSYLNNYATPLSQQYGNAQKISQYQLANQGLLGSTAAQKINSDLSSLFNTQQSDIHKKALDYVSKAKTSVLQAANDAYTTANPKNVLQVASKSAGDFGTSFTKNNAMPSLADVFTPYFQNLSNGQGAFDTSASNAFGGGGSGGGTGAPSAKGLPGNPASITQIAQQNNVGKGSQKVVN